MSWQSDHARRYAADPDGFVTLTGITNYVTGELVPIRQEIHVDDLDWYLQLQQDSFLLDWKIYQAGAKASPFVLDQGVLAR